jgi:hypothetical protein
VSNKGFEHVFPAQRDTATCFVASAINQSTNQSETKLTVPIEAFMSHFLGLFCRLSELSTEHFIECCREGSSSLFAQ